MIDWYDLREFAINLIDKFGDRLTYYFKLGLLSLTFVYAMGFFSHVFPFMTTGLYGIMVLLTIVPFIGCLFLSRFHLDIMVSPVSGFLFIAIPAIAIACFLWVIYGFGIFAAGGLV